MDISLSLRLSLIGKFSLKDRQTHSQKKKQSKTKTQQTTHKKNKSQPKNILRKTEFKVSHSSFNFDKKTFFFCQWQLFGWYTVFLLIKYVKIRSISKQCNSKSDAHTDYIQHSTLSIYTQRLITKKWHTEMKPRIN